MATLHNDTIHSLPWRSEALLNERLSDMDIDEATIENNPQDDDRGEILDVHDMDDEYLFSINIIHNAIFDDEDESEIELDDYNDDY